MGMFNALNLGDVTNEMMYRIRPYEVRAGATDQAMQRLCTTLPERRPFEDRRDLPAWLSSGKGIQNEEDLRADT
jgi:hypothetical protein